MELRMNNGQSLSRCFQGAPQGGAEDPDCPIGKILDGILWILRTGAPWHDLPDRYPSYQTCHRRFQEWRKAGVFEAVLQALARTYASAAVWISTKGMLHRWHLCHR